MGNLDLRNAFFSIFVYACKETHTIRLHWRPLSSSIKSKNFRWGTHEKEYIHGQSSKTMFHQCVRIKTNDNIIIFATIFL